MVQSTSKEAYMHIIPRLGEKQRTILNIIKLYPGVSNLDISRICNFKINSVTPRVKELRDKGLVEFCFNKVDRVTHRTVMCWRCKIV